MNSFNERVYEVCRKIPEGRISTYGEIAKVLGCKAYRAVGQALKRNKDPVNIPCYKVIKSDGGLGGYSGKNPKNIRKKVKLLEKDGIEIINGKIDLKKYLYKFE